MKLQKIFLYLIFLFLFKNLGAQTKVLVSANDTMNWLYVDFSQPDSVVEKQYDGNVIFMDSLGLNKIAEIEFKNGKRNGKCVRFVPKNKILLSGFYYNNYKTGLWKLNYENKLFLTKEYSFGELNGALIKYENDTIKSIENYKNNVAMNFNSFYKNGKLNETYYYQNFEEALKILKENQPLSAVCLTDCSYLVFKDSTSAIDNPYVIYGEGWNTELNLGTTYNIDGNIVQQFQFYKDKIIELNFDSKGNLSSKKTYKYQYDFKTKEIIFEGKPPKYPFDK